LAKQLSYGAPISFVDKKDDKLRMCINYSALKKEEMDFLGHILSKEKVRHDLKKLQTIRD
jgi:hypothetical protein